MPWRRGPLFGLLFSCALAAGCVVGPLQDDGVPGTDVITYAGYAQSAGAEIELSLRNPNTGAWTVIETIEASQNGVTAGGMTFYRFETGVDLGPLAATYGTQTAEGVEYEARSRDVGLGTYLATFDAEGIDCVVENLDQGWVTAGYQCMDPDTPVLTFVDRLWGPANRWWHAQFVDVAPLEGDVVEVGHTAPNAVWPDQFGDDVELHQFYGHVTVVKVFAQWCGPCRASAAANEQFWQDHEDEGLEFVSVMLDNNNYAAPDQGDLQDWVNQYGITHPVTRDQYPMDWMDVAAYPTYVVIDRDMNVQFFGYPLDEALVLNLLDD